MVEREQIREAEAEPIQFEIPADHWYERWRTRWPQVLRENATLGKIVVKGKELPWQLARQALLKIFLPHEDSILENDLSQPAMRLITMFQQHIPVRSGKHRHQGGLAIFVVEGEGYTTVDGVKHPWKAGDLILLPIKPGGVEHQHFNTSPKPARWMAIAPHFYREPLAAITEQVEESPLWKKEYEDVYKKT